LGYHFQTELVQLWNYSAVTLLVCDHCYLRLVGTRLTAWIDCRPDSSIRVFVMEKYYKDWHCLGSTAI